MSKSRPRVAVLMAAHNAEATIRRAVDSLALDTEPHDILIVDDGSRFPVQRVLEPLAPNVRVIRLDTNVGVTAASNIGLKLASEAGYEFVAILDADDRARSNRLSKQIARFDARRELMLVATWAEVVDSLGRKLHEVKPSVDPVMLRRELRMRNPVVHSSIMFRTELVAAVGPYDESFETSQDYEFVCRAAERHEIAVIPEVLTDYFVIGSSISSKRRRSMTWNSLRVRLRYFNPLRFESYWGVVRSVPAMLLPRQAATLLRSAATKVAAQIRGY